MRVKQIAPHMEGCNALAMVERGDLNNPLFMSARHGTENRDKLGRRSRSGSCGSRWIAVVCNSTSCPGRWLVAVDDIEQAVFEALGESSDGVA